MSFPNLPKTFKYVNENNDSIIFEWKYGFLPEKPQGIDVLTVSHSEAQGINQVGSTIQSSNVQSRVVNMSGRIVGANQLSKKELLLSVVRPDLSGRLYADDYYLEVRPATTPTFEAREHNASYQFSLLAAYPYWQKDDSAAATLSSVAKRFKLWDNAKAATTGGNGRWWNISGGGSATPYRFGEVVEAQFVNIFNGGQVPIPFTVTFKALAEVQNPKLTDAATNKFLLLNKTLVAGEIVTVEITHERTYVNSSVDGECRGALDLDSSFYRLAVGDNVIKPEATSGKENMRVTIDFATEVVGIAL